MIKFKNTISYTFIALISIFLYTELINFFFSEGLNGHDNFQYLGWSKVIFTEERNLSFYRPVLYWIINIFCSTYGWLPESYGILLSSSLITSSFLFYILLLKKYDDAGLAIFGYLCLISSPWLVQALKVTYVNVLELSFIILFICSYFYFFKKKNHLSIFFLALSGYFLTHIHEDKFLLVFFIFFYSFIFCKKKERKHLIQSGLIFISLCLITLLNFNLSEIIHSILSSGGSVGRSENISLVYNLIQNFLIPIKNSSHPFLSNVIIGLFVIFPFFTSIKKNKFEYIIFLSVFSYVLLMSLVFGQIKVIRVLHPIIPLIIIVCASLLNIFCKNISIYFKNLIILILIAVCTNNFYYKTYFNFKKINNENSHHNYWFESYKFINKQRIANPKIFETSSIENRIPGWGINKNNYYGLSSPVYFSKNSINTNYFLNVKKNQVSTESINKVIDEYDIIVFNNLWTNREKLRTKKKLKMFDNKLIKSLKKNSNFKYKNFKKDKIDLDFYIKQK